MNCNLNFISEVGIFLNDGPIRLIGEGRVWKENNHLYADLKVDFDLSDYFPQTSNLGKTIDLILFSTKKDPQSSVKKIGDQVVMLNGKNNL